MLSYVVSGEAIAQTDILRQCGSKYQDLKAANGLNGKNWDEFFLECRNQYSKDSLEQSNSASAQLILSNCAKKYQEQKSYKEHNGLPWTPWDIFLKECKAESSKQQSPVDTSEAEIKNQQKNQQTQKNTNIFTQLLSSVSNPTDSINTETLAKIAVVSAKMAVMSGLDYHSNLELTKNCYIASFKSKQMRNIVACYILDYEVANRLESAFGKQGLKKQSSKVFQSALNAEGIYNEQIINQLNHEALEEH